MKILGYLLAGIGGVLIGSAMKDDKKSPSPSPVNYPEPKTWNEQIAQRIDDEGFHFTFDGYSDFDDVKDDKFHKLRKAYLASVKALNSSIKNDLTKDQKEYMDNVIDKEGYDYAFDGYSDFTEYYDYDAGEYKPITNKEFHSKIKQYLAAKKALSDYLRII